MSRPVEGDAGVVTAYGDGTVTLRANRRTEGYHESADRSGYIGVRAGDLVVHGLDLVQGSVGVSDSDGKMSPVCRVLAPRPDMDARFLAHALRTIARAGYVRANARGVRSAGADYRRWETLAEVPVPAPPLRYQRRVAAFLDRERVRVAEMLAGRRRVAAAADERLLARIDELVFRAPAPAVRIGTHFGVTTGKTLSGGGGTGDSFLSTFNVQWDGISLDDLKRTPFTAAERRLLALAPGDLLVCEGGEIGRCAIVDAPLHGASFQNHLHRVRPRSARATTEYLRYFLMGMVRTGRLRGEYGIGATIANLSAGRLRAVTLPLPAPERQREICAELGRLEDGERRVRRQLERIGATLIEYRDALVTEAVTCRLDVDVRPDATRPEPESALAA